MGWISPDPRTFGQHSVGHLQWCKIGQVCHVGQWCQCGIGEQRLGGGQLGSSRLESRALMASSSQNSDQRCQWVLAPVAH